MDKKDFLRSYERAKRYEARCKLRLEEYRARQMGVAVKYSDMPKGTDLHDLSDYMVGLEEIEKRLAMQFGVTNKVYDIVMKALSTVSDPIEYDVLFYRYIKGMTAATTGMKVCMSDWNVYKVEKKAFEHLEVTQLDYEMVESLLTYKMLPELKTA